MKAFLVRAIVLLVVTIPLGAACFEMGDITVSGSNRLECWLLRERKEKAFGDTVDVEEVLLDNRFDIDVSCRDFLLGFRYQIVEPSILLGYERREGFYRRYVEYDTRQFGIRAGNYYVMFGRGLSLRAYEDDIVYLDRDIDGVKMRGSTDWLDIVAISGRPRNTEFAQLVYEVTNDTNDILRGGDFSLYPFPFLTAGASYVLLTEKDLFNPPLFSRSTEVYGARASLNVWNFDVYGEIAKKHGWDALAVPARYGVGYGIYGSASFSFPGYGVTFQFGDYDSIGLGGWENKRYTYNSPPILNRNGKSINYGDDETGYQVESYLSPIEPLNITLSYSDIMTSDDTLNLAETFAEVFYQRLGLFDLRITFEGFDRIEEVEIRSESGMIVDTVIQWKEQIPKLQFAYHLAQSHCFGLGYDHRVMSGSLELQDSKLYVSYTYAPRVTVTLTGERRDKEIEHIPGWEGKEWWSAQIDWDITQDHRLTLVAGKEKGGLVCSGGVCGQERSFEGLKAIFTSRF